LQQEVKRVRTEIKLSYSNDTTMHEHPLFLVVF